MYKSYTFAGLKAFLLFLQVTIVISISSCSLLKKPQSDKPNRKERKIIGQIHSDEKLSGILYGQFINDRQGRDTNSIKIVHDTVYPKVKIPTPKDLNDQKKQNNKIKDLQDQLGILYNTPECQRQIHDAFIEGRDYAIEEYTKAINDYHDTVVNTFKHSVTQDHLVMNYMKSQYDSLSGVNKQLNIDKQKEKERGNKFLYILIGLITLIVGIAGLKLWMKYRPTNSINPLKILKP